jgi:HAD superfamily hydrolase (TIGR01549 family)
VTRTLLLDLDDTLLDNETGEFLPVYLKKLGDHLASHAPPDKLVPALLAATRAMIQNNEPDRTLKDIFDAQFYPSLGIDEEAIRADIEDFYANVFPSLRSLTQPKPEAIEVVQYAFDCGYQVVVATNPIFPQSAILQRLGWANLWPENYAFKLIVSYETFHFAKPNPAFFGEILARLGWPTGPVIMVGDDLENDIHAARRLGLAAFWLTQKGQTPKTGLIAPTAAGSLADVIPWLEATASDELIPQYASTDSLVATLRATPAALSALSIDVPTSAYNRRPISGEWSLTEILCHLRDVEQEVNLPRVHKVMNETDPFLPGMVTDPWAEEREYICQDGRLALEAFTRNRLQMLELLDSLSQDDWQRRARHAIFGPTQLKELVSINAGHDRLHVRQFLNTITNTINAI